MTSSNLFRVRSLHILTALISTSLVLARLPGPLHSFSGSHGLRFFATLIAASLIWLPARTVRGWTWVAFIVLCIGMAPIALSMTALTIPAIAVLAVASVRLWHLQYRPTPRQFVLHGARPIVLAAMKTTRRPANALPAAAPAKIASAQPITPPLRTELAPPPRPSAAPAPRPNVAPNPATPEFDFSDNVQTPRYTFADVVGMAATKKRLLGATQDVLLGQTRPRNGILLFGEPGNGKTMFAEAVAGELNIPFFSISYGDTASKWVNETPQKVKSVFAAAKRTGACVLFIDEIDSFIKPRDGQSHSMDKDLTNVMLTEIVSVRGSKVILMAATNLLDALDSAGKRDGRFDFKIEIPSPDLDARIALLERAVEDELGSDFIERGAINALARRWDGFSAARLTSLGGQLREMYRDGVFGGAVTFDVGMKAMRLLQGRKGKLPEDVKAIKEILMPNTSRAVLRDLAFKMEELENLEKLGASLPRGIVFTGPPGTGKTQAAMALAKASNWAFLKITGAQIIADPQSWDRIYREARDIRPAIVFIDEADGILLDRRHTNYGMLTEKILTTMDGADGRTRDVIFIAATNYYDRIDAAAVRGGRFEEKVAFAIPGPKTMAAYVRWVLKKKLNNHWNMPSDVVDALIAHVSGKSIADADAVIERTVANAALRRMRGGTSDIWVDDVKRGAQAVFA
jgi:transitional endoplasmic reticulum ATPase